LANFPNVYVPFIMELLYNCTSVGAIPLADILMYLIGILSGPELFAGFSCLICLITSLIIIGLRKNEALSPMVKGLRSGCEEYKNPHADS